jgi:hypothetical protein
MFGFSGEQRFAAKYEAPDRRMEAFVLDVAASRLDSKETTARLRKLLKQAGNARS